MQKRIGIAFQQRRAVRPNAIQPVALAQPERFGSAFGMNDPVWSLSSRFSAWKGPASWGNFD